MYLLSISRFVAPKRNKKFGILLARIFSLKSNTFSCFRRNQVSPVQENSAYCSFRQEITIGQCKREIVLTDVCILIHILAYSRIFRHI